MNLQPLLKVKNNKTSEIVLEHLYIDIKTGEEYQPDKTINKIIKTDKKYKQVPEKTTKIMAYNPSTKTCIFWKEQEK